jgi:predicted dehydrogenase
MSLAIGMLGVTHPHAGERMRRLVECDRVSVVGSADPNPEAAEKARGDSRFSGVEWFATPERLLEHPDIQAVWVEGSPLENVELARKALLHNKHVLMEKPAGTDIGAFKEVLELARDRGKHFQMGYNFRYHTGMESILEAARSGILGDVFFVRGRMSTNKSGHLTRLPELVKYPGGTFYELACHYLDMYVSLLGRPRTVTGFMRNHYSEDPRCMDNTLVVFEYDRALAVLESSDMEINAQPLRRVEVYGTGGTIIMQPVEPPRIRLCLEEAAGSYEKGWQDVDVGDRPRYVGDLEEFLACIEDGKKPDYDSAHDLLVQEVLLEAVRGKEPPA